jgi:hypothetical protein
MDPLLLAGAAAALVFLFRKKKPTRPPVVAPTVEPLPPPPGPRRAQRPPGHPPPYRGKCLPPHNEYDANFWYSEQTILDAFDILGYETPTDRTTMNRLGPDEKLGGGDDVPNAEVRRFQKDYNKVSLGGKFVPDMGGLDEDGLVGPCTLAALKVVLDSPDKGNWTQTVLMS